MIHQMQNDLPHRLRVRIAPHVMVGNLPRFVAIAEIAADFLP